MKTIFLTVVTLIAVGSIALPASAQTFFDDLRDQLGSTSTLEAPVVVGAPAPSVRANVQLGAKESGTSTPASVAPASNNAYVAGTDIWTGPIAGTAAVLSAILIGLVLWLVLGHRGSRES